MTKEERYTRIKKGGIRICVRNDLRNQSLPPPIIQLLIPIINPIKEPKGSGSGNKENNKGSFRYILIQAKYSISEYDTGCKRYSYSRYNHVKYVIKEFKVSKLINSIVYIGNKPYRVVKSH